MVVNTRRFRLYYYSYSEWMVNKYIYYYMNIQYYIRNNFAKFYLPYLLFREILTKVVKEKFNIAVEYVYKLESLKNDSKTIIITNLNSIDDNILNTLSSYNSIKILINTEYYENFSTSKYLEFINNKPNFHLLEYNIININYLKNSKKNISYHFIPLCYNSYLEDFYSSRVVKKKFAEKDIDILFLGTLNNRRKHIINNLQTRYNVSVRYLFGENRNTELCDLIERSKIVLNVLYYHNNIVFDYYRNSFILSTRTLLITEKSTNKDYNIEDGLLQLENNIINVEYDQLIDTVDKYMKISEDEYNKLVYRQNNSLKQYKMDDKIIHFFNKIL